MWFHNGFLKVIYVPISGKYLGGQIFVLKVCKGILPWIDGHSPEEKDNVHPQAFKGLSAKALRIRNMDGLMLLIYVLGYSQISINVNLKRILYIPHVYFTHFANISRVSCSFCK